MVSAQWREPSPQYPPHHITDVINVAGHRLSTAEIESALILHPGVAETAVIGSADELTGQAVSAFVTLKPCVFFHSTLVVPSEN
jgi:acyl-coenzyme A synthetase/AMP-(fatty) acid ligase